VEIKTTTKKNNLKSDYLGAEEELPFPRYPSISVEFLQSSL
jgi:hypothetical protein